MTTASTCSKHGAAVHQSKYALRHLYYDADYSMKEGAGFMTGKVGSRREWKLLNMGIRMGVPVVLADVTNIVRHGDFCALAGEDPIPIEVKSIKNRSARTVADQPLKFVTSRSKLQDPTVGSGPAEFLLRPSPSLGNTNRLNSTVQGLRPRVERTPDGLTMLYP